MGTSANLGIKCGKKQWVEHTSYDATLSGVFSQIGATVAACGLDALRQAISKASLIGYNEGMEDEQKRSSSHAGFAAYLDACKGRSQEPWGLMEAVRYPYGTADFAHGGVITLMGSPLFYDNGWGELKDADFLLDLDAGTLSYREYANHEDYQAGKPAESVAELDLSCLDGLSPEQVFLALSQMQQSGVEDFAQRKADNASAIEDAMNKAQSNTATPPSWFTPHTQTPPAVVETDGGPGPNEKGTHVFYAHPDDGPSLRLLIGVLQRAAVLAPSLARSTAIMAQMSPDKDGAISVSVDFSDGFTSSQEGKHTHALVGKLGDAAPTLGMDYRFGGGGVIMGRGAHGGFSSISIGGDFDDDDELEGIFGGSQTKLPPGSSAVRTSPIRLADAIDDAAAMDEAAVERLKFEKQMARASFDKGMLAVIPDSIVLSTEETKLSNGLMVALAPLEDPIVPGVRRDRFLALDVAQRAELVSALTPLGRFVFMEELGVDESSLAPKISPRP